MVYSVMLVRSHPFIPIYYIYLYIIVNKCPIVYQYNTDAVYVMAFSIIMLNTDQHNPHIKNRMTQKQWLANNRGLNGGNDYPAWLLNWLFETIQSDEIKFEDDSHGNSALISEAMKKGKRFQNNNIQHTKLNMQQQQQQRINHLTSIFICCFNTKVGYG